MDKKAPVPAKDFAQERAVVRAKDVDAWKNLSAAQRRKVNEKLRFLKAVKSLLNQDYTQTQACEIVSMKTELYPELSTAGKGGTSAMTVFNYRKWIKKLGKARNGNTNWDNAHALADRYSCGIKKTEFDPDFLRALHAAYMNENKLSLKEAYSLALTIYKKEHPIYNAAGIPSYDQARYYYNHKVDRKAIILAREGKEYFENHVQGYISRDWSAIQPGSVWFGDHHVFDAPVKVFDEETNAWKACRPWFTAWMDAKSHYFIGYIVRADEDPNSLAIEDALLNGIRNAGNQPPDVLYIDNGKDYVSKGLVDPVEINGYEHSIAAELGARHICALPYNAKAKVIERRFKEVAGAFAKFWPGYLGNRPGARPEAAQTYWKNPEMLPSLNEFCQVLEWWLSERYHNAPNNSKITGGKPPAEVWQARAKRRSMQDRDIYMAMLKPLNETRQVRRGAEIQVNNKFYQSDELWNHFGQNVMIKMDRFNDSRIWAFEPSGKLICMVPIKGTVPAICDPETEGSLISENMANNRRIMSHTRQKVIELTGDNKPRERLTAAVDRLQLVAPETTEADVIKAIAAPGSPRQQPPQKEPESDIWDAFESINPSLSEDNSNDDFGQTIDKFFKNI